MTHLENWNTRTMNGARRSRSDQLSRSAQGAQRGFQIGPRIRVGGTLGKIGQDIKETTGKVLSNPIVDGALTFIPGIGPVIAGAAGAAGKILDTTGGGLHGVGGVLDVAKGAASGFAAGKVATGLKSTLDAASGGSVLDKLKSILASGGSLKDAAAQLLGGGGDPTGAGGGGTSFGDKLLLGGATAAATADKLRQQGMQDRGISYATGAYDEKAPLRSKAIGMLQNPNKPDLTSLFADAGNVYDQQRRGTLPTRAPAAAAAATGGDALSGALASRVKASSPMSALANSY